jgi:hypothetical protein
MPEDRKLFPGLPENFEQLDGEALQGLLKDYRAVGRRILDRDPELLGDMSRAAALEQFKAGSDEITTITERLEVLGQADTQFEESLLELAAKSGIEPTAEGDDDTEGDDTEGGDAEGGDESAEGGAEAEVTAEAPAEGAEAPAEPVAEEVVAEEPVLAAGELPAKRKPKPALPAPTQDREPLPAAPTGAAIVASAGISGIREGEELDRMGLARAIMARRGSSVSTPQGVEEKAIVASINYGELFPEERILRGVETDQEKIDRIVSPEALVASGGLCAPVTPYYDLMNISTTSRPVRDALAGFIASRGGLRFAAVPVLTDVETSGDNGAVGIRTAAQDAAGGTNAEKSCQIVACPPFEEALLSMIYHCVQFGNLNSRAWPEQIAQFNDLVRAAHARVAETALIDGIASYSTAVTAAATYGATSTLLNGILQAAAGMRSRHRMDPNARLRVLMPAWAADLLVADLVNSQFHRFEYSVAGVEQLLESLARVTISFYLDSPTGEGQIFPAQGTGPLQKFPTSVVWYIYPEGSFLFLDGGTLELGIVRDSTLNNTNDYRIFGESFEQVAFVGPESLEVESTVCPTGTTGGTATAITC